MGRHKAMAATVAGLGLAALVVPVSALGGGAKTTLVSVGLDGAGANGPSGGASVSAHGRYVAFTSDASNLVPGDTNAVRDVFVRDVRTGETERVSVASGGSEANGTSGDHSISADGRFVAFVSRASNLVDGDTNGFADVFVRDRETGKTERVNVRRNGEEANGDSYSVSISASGRYVAFDSDAANLLGPGDPGRATDVFVRDLRTGKTRRATVGRNGAYSSGWSPMISADGRFVAFTSGASNLVRGDPNRYYDVFVRDLEARRTRLVSVGWKGAVSEGDHWGGSISAHGRFVVFGSDACCLVRGDPVGAHRVYVRDLKRRKTRVVSVRWDGVYARRAGGGSISANGRYVAFHSRARLVKRDTNQRLDVFVRDLKKRKTRRVSIGVDGAAPNGRRSSGSISADGRFVFITSNASNLVARDENGHVVDIFRRGPLR